MLRLLLTVLVTVLLLATAAHAAENDRRGAGSVADYEFPAASGAGTMSLIAPRAEGEGCLLHAPYDDACVDGSACWVNDPAAVQDPKRVDGPRPKRGDHVAFMSCLTASGDHWARWYWSSDRGAVAG